MPLAAAIPAIIGVAGSVGAGLIGAHGAQTAAAQQSAAAQKGINLAQANTGSAINNQNLALQSEQSYYNPYLQAGGTAIGQLSSMMGGTNGLLTPWQQQFQAPTAAQAAATPGYQFARDQALQGMQNSAAARGNLLTGGTTKSLMNYATGLASGTYQQTYNNAFQNYMQNYAQFQQNQQNAYSRLMGLGGMGFNATANMAGLTQNNANAQAGIWNANTAAMSQLLGAQGAAQASGTMGAANAYSGMVGNIANNVTQGIYDYQNRPAPAYTNPGLQNPGGTFGSDVAPTGISGVMGTVPGMSMGLNTMPSAIMQGMYNPTPTMYSGVPSINQNYG